MNPETRKPSSPFKKVAITAAGFAVILVGIFLLVLPGPGIVLMIAGLAILGTEYHWARRLVQPARDWLKRRKEAAQQKMREAKEADKTTPPPDK